MANMTYFTQYAIMIIGYFFFCRFAFTLLDYLKDLKTNSINGGNTLRGLFDSQYRLLVQDPLNSYKERNNHLNPQRANYRTWTLVSVLLVVFNSFILAEFLAEVGNLSQVIMYVPIRLEYSHLIAAVIVLVELFSGFGYYISHSNQEKYPENTIWAFMKYACIITFICLMTVETIMWMNLSVLFDMSERLELGSNNIFKNFVDYFLSALGIGITVFEFMVGFQSGQFREYKGDSIFLNVGKFWINTIGLILLLFFPRILLIIISGAVIVMMELIKFSILPGNYVYELVTKKKSQVY